MSITKTYSYIMTYKFIEPVIKSYYSKPIVIKEKGKYDKESILSLVLSYMSGLNRSFNILMQISTKDIEEKVSIQLATILGQFMLDEEDKLEMKKATLRYWINRLLINKWEETHLYNYLFVKLEELGGHAINKIVDLKEVPSSEDEEKQSYSYTLVDEDVQDSLTGLFKSLKEKKCIDPATEFETFYDAFTGKHLGKIKKKIKWIRPKILLVYFIVRLQHLKKIGIYDLEPNYKIQDDSNYWNKMEAVFMDKNGMPMDNGAREYAKIGSELVPKNVEIIDNILIRGISGPINQYDSLR